MLGRHWSKVRLLTSGAQELGTNGSCSFSPLNYAWQALEQSQTSTFECSRYLVPTEAAHSLLLTMLGSPIQVVGVFLSMVGGKLLLNEEMLTAARFSAPK
ncbi:hypothetical protein AVEN_167493-1 [Araneus ventricosus]|uniref:Uncharacterized protein n=1 Tax=Araneus ventricosus TaxID=182803 RepID=A0A4Y2UPR7_ARAVE|nr:hypothetical protein AVEN_167493-1 [Araneus ventricosus]